MFRPRVYPPPSHSPRVRLVDATPHSADIFIGSDARIRARHSVLWTRFSGWSQQAGSVELGSASAQQLEPDVFTRQALWGRRVSQLGPVSQPRPSQGEIAR